MNAWEAEEERKELEEERREYFLNHSRLHRAYKIGVRSVAAFIVALLLTVVLYSSIPIDKLGENLTGLCIVTVLLFFIGVDVLLGLLE